MIKIFRGTSIERMETVVNDFEKENKVFATQSHVVPGENVDKYVFVVYYK